MKSSNEASENQTIFLRENQVINNVNENQNKKQKQAQNLEDQNELKNEFDILISKVKFLNLIIFLFFITNRIFLTKTSIFSF